jgi:glycosyltransferase involved in cell wall biosynthesis
MTSARGPDVAIVHDYLTQRGGAERVVLSMLKAFPGTTVHTSLYDPHATFPDFASADVRTLAIDRIAVLRQNHRFALPLLAPSFSTRQIEADVVLCSSSGWAHGVRTAGRKIVYCYSPARWLYQGRRYLGEGRTAAQAGLDALRPWLQRWDRRAAATAHRYLTLSNAVRDRIRDAYGIDAEVIPPPQTMDPSLPQSALSGVEPGYVLCVARLLPYKNVDAVVEAFAELPAERLVVAGTGPERHRLEAMAGPNVSFVGVVDDPQLRWLYASSCGVVAASYEDYGLTPLEGAAFGKPAAVLAWGGFLETVAKDETGVFFDSPTPDAIAAAVRRLVDDEWDEAELREQAARFAEIRFVERLREIVAEEASRY